MDNINIFEYIDISQYLSDCLKYKKQENTMFSLRAWASRLGMKSHGPLHAMLTGKRKIPKKYIPLLIKDLKLTKKQSSYFELLIDYQRSKGETEKEFYFNKLNKISPSNLRETNDIEAYKYLTDPLHIIISEMTQLKNYQHKIGWIKNHLRFNASLKDIEQVLHRLIDLNVLEIKNNRVKKTVQHIYTQKEKLSKAVQIYHQKMSQASINAIEKQAISQREFNAVSFNINNKDLDKIKEDIAQFCDQLVQNYESKPHEGDETYHLNVQLFSLSK